MSPEATVTVIHEIAVRQVKPGKDHRFRKARAAFISVLKRQPGVLADREFESFRAMPEPDLREVFIGMTTYASAKANAKVQRTPSVLWRFLAFARTMSLKAYLYVRPTEGPPFDLATLAAEPGQVLEVGVRRVTDRAGFDRLRTGFVQLLSSQPGVLDSWEFEVVKGKNIEGLSVGMTVYESEAALDAATTAVMREPITAAYFATFDPVALQFARSVSNS